MADSSGSCCCGGKPPLGCPCAIPFPWSKVRVTVTGIANSGNGPFGACYDDCSNQNLTIWLTKPTGSSGQVSTYTGSVTISKDCPIAGNDVLTGIMIGSTVTVFCYRKVGDTKAYYSVSGGIGTTDLITNMVSGITQKSAYHNTSFHSDGNNPQVCSPCGSDLTFEIPAANIVSIPQLNTIGTFCNVSGAHVEVELVP